MDKVIEKIIDEQYFMNPQANTILKKYFGQVQSGSFQTLINKFIRVMIDSKSIINAVDFKMIDNVYKVHVTTAKFQGEDFDFEQIDKTHIGSLITNTFKKATYNFYIDKDNETQINILPNLIVIQEIKKNKIAFTTVLKNCKTHVEVISPKEPKLSFATAAISK